MPTITSSRREQTLHLGKRSPKEDSDVVPYGEVRKALAKKGALPKPPVIFGHGHSFRQGAWRMLGNGPCDDNSIPQDWAAYQGCGDCAVAGPAHEEMEAANTSRKPTPNFTARNIVEAYAKWCYGGAYDPKSGEGDEGSIVTDVLKARQTEGLPDADGKTYKIGRAVSIEPGHILHVWECAWLFETVGGGFVITEAQEDQFNLSTQPTWDFVKGSPEVGGHYVPLVGKFGLISWAEDVYYTPRFIEKQMDEAYAWIDPLRYNAITGETYEHFKDADLEKYLVMVAQAKIGSA